jgi:hypothetical protein
LGDSVEKESVEPFPQLLLDVLDKRCKEVTIVLHTCWIWSTDEQKLTDNIITEQAECFATGPCIKKLSRFPEGGEKHFRNM